LEADQIDIESDAEPKPPVVQHDRRSLLYLAVAIAAAGVLFAAYGRYLNVNRPGVATPGGFYGASAHGQPDQFYYLRSARLLAHWHFPHGQSQYRYGLGYPILAAPFIRLGFGGDPFAPVDALAFGATLGLTFLLGTCVSPFRSRGLTIACGLATAATVGVASPLIGLMSTPWNSNIVVPLGVFVLLVTVSERDVSIPAAAGIGLALGWIFATRYLDALFLGLPVIALIVRSSAAQRRRILIISGGTLAVVVLGVLASQQYAFGNFMTTPYHYHARSAGATNDQSLSEYRISSIPTHFSGTFITGKNGHGVRQNHNPILRDFPLLVFAPFGAYVISRRRSRVRAAWISAIVGSVLGSLFYLSFVAGGGGDLNVGNARYWAPWYPLWAALAILAIATIAQRVMKGESGNMRV
jgi:hypothetical protein